MYWLYFSRWYNISKCRIIFDLSKVNVVSFNVNGLRNELKRRSIFNLLKYDNNHIILLQETHSMVKDEQVWSNEWGSKIYFAHGTNFSRGVMVMFHRNFPVIVEDLRYDKQGRYIILDLKIGEIKFILSNVYGPNEDDEDFFIRWFQVLESRDNSSMLLAGDFNCSLDPEYDLFNNNGLNHTRKRITLQESLDVCELVDIWRIRNPDKKVFTWRKPNSRQLIMSRLDYFLVSQDLSLRVISADIKPKFISDHSRIVMTVDFSKAHRGKGF